MQVINFRVDGDGKIGLGHLVRSAALASGLGKNFTCRLFSKCTVANVLDDMRQVYAEVISIPRELDAVSDARFLAQAIGKGGIAILDGYGFNTEYQAELIRNGVEHFSIDDIHSFGFLSRIIINHSGGTAASDYSATPGTQFLLGLNYALLREPFLEAARHRRSIIDNNNCFICFGGADPDNRTLDVLKKLVTSKVNFESIHVVTGGAYAHRDKLADYVSDLPHVQLYSSLEAGALANLMRRCAYAVCSPSTVVLEYLSVGGIVYLEQIADNQSDVIRHLISQGLAFSFADISSVTDQSKTLALRKQAENIDGLSMERLQKVMRVFFETRHFQTRRAVADDLMLCHTWANDPEVRSQSFNQNAIPLDQHSAWFDQRINDPGSFFYIIEQEGKPIAQVRFQLKGTESVISYLSDASVRSRGWGTSILSAGIQKFTAEFQGPVTILGYVKASNFPSRRSFEKLGFDKSISTEYPDSFKYSISYGY